MIGIVDYGMGNLQSVRNALEFLGAEVAICNAPEELEAAERLVLPGVGAFRDCMANLTERGLVDALNREVLMRKKPIMGICMGMQAMARSSTEGGWCRGLGWLEADVVQLKPEGKVRVPHVGWNDVQFRPRSPFFARLPPGANFYFVHSYYMRCDRPAEVEATCEHGITVTASVVKNNIFATQFHPEKSQSFGLAILENFMAWVPGDFNAKAAVDS